MIALTIKHLFSNLTLSFFVCFPLFYRSSLLSYPSFKLNWTIVNLKFRSNDDHLNLELWQLLPSATKLANWMITLLMTAKNYCLITHLQVLAIINLYLERFILFITCCCSTGVGKEYQAKKDEMKGIGESVRSIWFVSLYTSSFGLTVVTWHWAF